MTAPARSSAGTSTHTYRTPGTYTATVTATDRDGAFDTAEVTIVVDGPPANQPPTVEIAADAAVGHGPAAGAVHVGGARSGGQGSS